MIFNLTFGSGNDAQTFQQEAYNIIQALLVMNRFSSVVDVNTLTEVSIEKEEEVMQGDEASPFHK